MTTTTRIHQNRIKTTTVMTSKTTTTTTKGRQRPHPNATIIIERILVSFVIISLLITFYIGYYMDQISSWIDMASHHHHDHQHRTTGMTMMEMMQFEKRGGIQHWLVSSMIQKIIQRQQRKHHNSSDYHPSPSGMNQNNSNDANNNTSYQINHHNNTTTVINQPRLLHKTIPKDAMKRKAHLTCDPYHYYDETKQMWQSFPYHDTIVQGMVYWQDIPTDHIQYYDHHRSSSSSSVPKKYITFELDAGGWNNVRMAFETVLLLAYSMNRILVLPPEQDIYLLDNNHNNNNHHDHPNATTITNRARKHFLYDLFSLADIQEDVIIITTEEFLRDHVMTGKVKHRITHEMVAPPQDHRTNWDYYDRDPKSWEMMMSSRQNATWPKHYFQSPFRILYDWLLRDVAQQSDWNPETCIVTFIDPTTDHHDTIQSMFQSFYEQCVPYQSENHTVEEMWLRQYINHPTPVNGTILQRLLEISNHRCSLCEYNTSWEQEHVIHYVGGQNSEDIHHGRLLTSFYSFVFHTDWRMDAHMKRYIRDHVRYNDIIQCTAARIVQAIRTRVQEKKKNYHQNGSGDIDIDDDSYDAFHVRRGEFQYKKTKISSYEMYEIAKDIIPDGATVYIATDAKQKKLFFINMSSHYDLLFLEDFMYLINTTIITPSYYGMIEQLIVTQSRNFFGCWFSTFTNYINRIRGYHTDMKKIADGYEYGIIPSYYYALPQHKYQMRQYYPIHGMSYSREFPISWRDIDQGIIYDYTINQETNQIELVS